MRPDASVESHHFEALGTNCSLFAVGLSHGRLLEAEFWVRRLGARLTRFSEDSELSRLNRAAGEWVPISDEMNEILHAALRAYEMSAGLVNVAVLPAMLAIGYTRPLHEGPGVATLESLRPLLPLPDVLELRDGEARMRAACSVDLGGIAKGWMADRLSETLGPNVVVNLGGDLRARGAGPRGDGWPVGLGGATLLLRNQGAATSSVQRRRWGELHHLIDPRTGSPARTGLEEVSVVAASGFEAEVVAKTALLLGPDLAPAYCAAHAMAWWLSGTHDD
jgi:thiamine biosynthesis lipoprotein